MRLQREDDAGSDTTRARRLREALAVGLRVHAWRLSVPTKVRTAEAAEAALCVLAQVGRNTARSIAGEHAEALLSGCISSVWKSDTTDTHLLIERDQLTGLKAVVALTLGEV